VSAPSLNGRHFNRSLRIAMVIPPWYEIPPSGYGGIEVVCAALVNALAARGHDVTVLGAGSKTGTNARFLSTIDEPQYERLGEALPAVLHAARVDALLRRRRFDVVHDHSPAGPLTASIRDIPTVVTVHGPVDGEFGDFIGALEHSVHPVAISDSQRMARPALPWAATVHNGVDTAEFTPASTPDGPVLWLARFCADKGPDLAIRACREAGLPLILAGKANEPAEAKYLREVVEPMLGDDVQLMVNADRTTTRALLRDARCLLMPIRWREPFGMVMVEAMASGTPVVALRRGSVPELVRHGVTGFVCDEPAQLPELLHRVRELDSGESVAHAQEAFSAELMASRYEDVYRHVIAQSMSLHTVVVREPVAAEAPVVPAPTGFRDGPM
jgi:glycosyltransferase involved in cell wall biosynthesis